MTRRLRPSERQGRGADWQRPNFAVPGPWVTDAACAGQTATMAMPYTAHDHRGAYTIADLAHIEQARTICNGCPVKRACLDWALTSPDDPSEGCLAGGHTPAERDRIRRGQPVRALGRQRGQAS